LKFEIEGMPKESKVIDFKETLNCFLVRVYLQIGIDLEKKANLDWLY
jgi:hypothetical protein